MDSPGNVPPDPAADERSSTGSSNTSIGEISPVVPIDMPEVNDEEKTTSIAVTDSLEDRGIVVSKWKRFKECLILLVITSLCVVASICYSFLSSAAHPIHLFPKAEQTILVLSIASTVSVFLLGELVLEVCDLLRWTLAARSSGVGFATFLGLGRATGLIGVLRLFLSTQETGHRKWCSQR
jgi:hypothetical protein